MNYKPAQRGHILHLLQRIPRKFAPAAVLIQTPELTPTDILLQLCPVPTESFDVSKARDSGTPLSLFRAPLPAL
jgi:hypothetical protein